MKFTKSTEDIIADFRGLPRTVSTSSRKPPTPIGNLLVVLKEQYKLETPSPERSLVENWEHVFGRSLAGRCNPVRIKDAAKTMLGDKSTVLFIIPNGFDRLEARGAKPPNAYP